MQSFHHCVLLTSFKYHLSFAQTCTENQASVHDCSILLRNITASATARSHCRPHPVFLSSGTEYVRAGPGHEQRDEGEG